MNILILGLIEAITLTIFFLINRRIKQIKPLAKSEDSVKSNTSTPSNLPLANNTSPSSFTPNPNLVDDVSVPESLINGRSFLNKFVGGIYLLNCPGSVPRFQIADLEMRKIGAPTYTRYNAWMGKKLEENYYELIKSDGSIEKLNFAHFRDKFSPEAKAWVSKELATVNLENFIKGSTGCYLSHLEIVKDAKAKGLKNIVIFEDDILEPVQNLLNRQSLGIRFA